MSEVLVGSGNVFEDLGFDNAEEMMTRANLTLRIHHIVKERGLKPKEAASLLDLPLPDASALMRGKFNDFSIDRLLRMLTRLDQVVTIQIKAKPKKRAHGGIEVLAA
ncbi:MAG: XRE family transcriptional regulator [Acidobacteria bacterium]|nr:XRE family transcriptional regulator [Acidobacteriota bacterium]